MGSYPQLHLLSLTQKPELTYMGVSNNWGSHFGVLYLAFNTAPTQIVWNSHIWFLWTVDSDQELPTAILALSELLTGLALCHASLCNSSQAALQVVSETLGLTLQPFLLSS